MKLLLFADKLPPEIGGMETHAKYFIKYFASKCDLYIITKKANRDCIVDSNFQETNEINIWDFLSLYKKERIVVFYNSGRWIESFERIKTFLPSATFFYRTGGNEIIKAPLYMSISDHKERQKYWVNAINKTIDCLIANSEFTKKRLLDIGVKEDIITIIQGGVCSENINHAIAKKTYTRKFLNCSNSEKLITCCNRFVAYKRPSFLLQAFSHLETPCKIVLVGDGMLLDNSKKIAKTLGLNNVTFLGKLSQEETLDIIAAADVYCQTSTDLVVSVPNGQYIHTEGMGRSLMESICCGTKVVATNCGALSEFINTSNGILIKGDEREFAKGVEQALLNPYIDESLRVMYTTKYDFNNIFALYSNLWRKEGFC